MLLMQLQDDIFRIGVCTKCKQEEILDSNRDICWDCWCLIDLENQEKEQGDDSSSGLMDYTEEE